MDSRVRGNDGFRAGMTRSVWEGRVGVIRPASSALASLGVYITCRQMSGQIHAVMQEPKHLDRLLWSRLKHHKVPPLSAMARHMNRTNSGSNILPLLGSQNFWTVVQCLCGQRDSLGVIISLSTAKILGGPYRHVEKIKLSLVCQPHMPDHSHAAAIALAVTDLRCARSDALESKVLKRPASTSAMPACTADRRASKR